MDRWVSASSPGPPTRARWRSCSSATLGCVLAREPVLIVPNRSDVERVERDLLARSGALLGGSIGTFDDVFERIAHAGGAARPLLRRLAAHAPRPPHRRRRVAERPRALGALRRLRRLPGGHVRGARVGPPRALGDRGRPRTALRRVPGRARPARPLGPRLRSRRYAVDRLQSDFDAWHGEPVFAYGFEDLTGAEWELLRALAGRTDVTVSVPFEAGPHGIRVAAADDGRPERARRRPDRGAARRGSTTSRIRRSRTSSAASSATSRPNAPQTGGAVRFFEGAGTRATLELVGQRDPLARSRRHRAGADRDRLPGARALARAARDRARRARRPRVGRDAAAAAADAVRARAPRAASLRLARRRPARALRLPAHAVLGRAARRRRTSSRDVSAAARSTRTTASRPRRSRCTGTRSRSSRSCARRRRRSTDCAERPRECSVTRTASTSRRRTTTARLDLRAYETVSRLADELEGWLALGGTLSADEIVGALERSTVRGADGREPRPRRGARSPPRAHAQLRGRVHPRARGGHVPAADAELAVPRRRRAP